MAGRRRSQTRGGRHGFAAAGLVIPLAIAVVAGCTPGAASSQVPTGAVPTPIPSAVPAPGATGVPTPLASRLPASTPGPASSPASTPSPLPTPVPSHAVEATPPPRPSPNVVTLSDNGSVLHVVVGDRFLLKLGSDLGWVVTVADENVVQRVIGVLVIQGAQGIYEAVSPGTTTLSAIGSPPCPSGGACPQFRVSFGITINVR